MKKSMLSLWSAICLTFSASISSFAATPGYPASPQTSDPVTASPAHQPAVCASLAETPREAAVGKLPVISDILIFQYQQSAGEYTLQVIVDDPNVSCQWHSDGTLSEIPYPGDASFLEHPNLFKAVEFTSIGEHYVAVTVSNAAGHDYYTKTFYVTSVKQDHSVTP